MHPKTPSQVVEWARRHLGLDRSFVVDRAVELQPDKERRRDPAQLQALWKDLVAHATEAVPAAKVALSPEGADSIDSVPPRAGAGDAAGLASSPEGADSIDSVPPRADAGDAAKVAPSPEDAALVDDFDLADLDELVEAPSHAHEIEQKIKATFPGAELTLLAEPEDDDASGEG